MKRRAFLGFLGGVTVSGPTMAKAATADLSSLALPAPTDNAHAPIANSIGGSGSWAKEALKRFLGKTAEQMAFERRSYHVTALDPNAASLRSVTLRHKIEMTRAVAYERRERIEEDYLRGHLKGWFE